MRNQPSTLRASEKMGDLKLPSRRDPVVRDCATAWRRLTSADRTAHNGPGAPTLIACSGGGDSSALVLALASAAGRHAPALLTIAHIVHDLRPASQSNADRDRAAQLAISLGLPFVTASVKANAVPGNAEANARRARYAALSKLAREGGFHFIATAHNSHDQAESVLMALLRGSGPRGLSGTVATRKLSPTLTLIRPMLGVSPTQARALCDSSGWSFAHDATNDDTTRFRNAIRAEILPRLLALRPGAERRIASAAERCRDASDAVSSASRSLLAKGRTEAACTWPRTRMRRVSPAILGETLRRAAAAVAGPSIADRLPSRTLQSAVRLIRSADTDPKVLQWSGARVVVDAHAVTVTAC